LGLLQSYVSDNCSADERPTKLGHVMAVGMGASTIFGSLFFAWVAERFGITTVCVVIVVIILLAVILGFLLPEASVRPQPEPLTFADVNPVRSINMLLWGSSMNTLATTRKGVQLMRKLFFTILFLYTSKYGLLLSLSLYAREEYNFSTMKASLLSTDYGIFNVIGQMAIPILIRPMSERFAVIFGVLCGCLCGVILAIPGVPGNAIFVSEALLSLSFIAYTVAVAMACSAVPKENVGQAVGIVNISRCAAYAFGPPLCGVLVHASLDTSYPGSAFIYLTIIMALGLLVAMTLPGASTGLAAQPT